MKTGIVWPVILLCATSAVAQDDEARIEQLLAPPHTVSKARARPPAGKNDTARAWLGQRVRVETVDRGLYLGTLLAASAESLTLEIAVPGRLLHYSLPRSAVAKFAAVDAAP